MAAKGTSAEVIGVRIAAQRRSVGMKQAQLAGRVGVHRNTISKWEKGETEPTGSEIFRVGEALGCGFLEILSPSARLIAPQFAFRAHKMLRKDVDLVVKGRKCVQAYREIEEILETPLGGVLRRYPFDPNETPAGNWIEMAAEELRESSGLGGRGPENLPLILESLGVRCLFFETPVKGIDALSTIYDGMDFVLLKRPERGIERTLFSAAHELGHLVLHPNLFATEDESEAQDNGRDYEGEANLFAGCFLVPRDDLIRVWKEERLSRLPILHAVLFLKRIFSVSFHCLFYRLRELGLSSVPHRTVIHALKQHLGIKGPARMEELEPEPLPPSILLRSTRFERLVQSAFLQEEIGVSKVAELFQITVDRAMKETNQWWLPQSALVE